MTQKNYGRDRNFGTYILANIRGLAQNCLQILQFFIHFFPFTLIFRYVCERRRDGISKIGPFGDEEGSDEPEVSYDCDGQGNYTFERENITNEIILPKCLERRKPFIRNH